MANLKDTIVLGNLTVTGKVVASDILVSGTGNEFDCIKVNGIYGNTTDIEIHDPVTTNSSLAAPGGIYVDYIENLDGDLELSSGNGIQMNVAESCSIDANSISLDSNSDITISSDSNISLVTSNKNGDSLFSLTANAMALTTVDSGAFAISLETITSSSDTYMYLDATMAQVIFNKTIAPITDDTLNCGTSDTKWKDGYFSGTIYSDTSVQTPSLTYSGGLSISCGGNLTLQSTSGGGGYVDLKAAYGIRPNVSIIPSVTTANLGASGTPFNSVYGKNFYASSDARLKENIVKSYFDYYNIIHKIQLVNYTWKSDEQHILHHGLIAQQLKEILPEELHSHLISESTDDEKMMSVNDGKLVYFALGALQQQLQINNKLEQRLQKLEELIRGDK
jgi:hypothetical protein